LDTSQLAAIAWAWLQKVLAYSAPSAALVFILFKWAGNTWVGRFLNRDLEKFKREQQAELERLKHLLSSRVSRIHEKEFEFLPKAWLMVNELRSAVAHAVDVTIKYYPDFHRFSDEKMERFLRDEIAAERLSDYQAGELRKLEAANQKQQYYMGAMMARNLNDAENKLRLFVNYLLENRIFMNAEIRKTFADVQQALISALTSYSIGKDAEDWEMIHEGQRAMIDQKMQTLVDEAERAIQKRLRFADAD
jgi:hypothetical protein